MSNKPVVVPAFSMLPMLLLGGSLPGSTQPPTLKRLEALAGHWILVDHEDEPTDLQATYRVVAGGSAVMETLFTGTPEETVTIYHADRARVPPDS